MSVTLEEVDEWIEEQIPLAEKEEADNYNRMVIGGSNQRELSRLYTIKELLCAGANIIEIGNGHVDIVEGKRFFRFYLLKEKWSSGIGINTKWRTRKRYWCKSPTDFVNKYVKGEK